MLLRNTFNLNSAAEMAISRSTSTNSIQFVVADTLTSLPPQSEDKDIQVDLSCVSKSVDRLLDDESQTEDELFSRSDSQPQSTAHKIPHNFYQKPRLRIFQEAKIIRYIHPRLQIRQLIANQSPAIPPMRISPNCFQHNPIAST